MFKLFDPNSECFAKYDAFCSQIFKYACLRQKAYSYRRGSKLQKKLYASKIFLKMAGGRMHILYPTPLDLPVAISYRNHQKNLAYFSHFAPLVLFFSLKGRVKRGGIGGGTGGAEGALAPPVLFQRVPWGDPNLRVYLPLHECI